MAAPKNAEYDAQTEATEDEWDRVEGGNYAPVWDFNEKPILIAIYRGFEEKNIKGDDKVIHTFEHPEIGEVQAWGAAVLDSRLAAANAIGRRVRVHKTGEKLTSSSGRNPWEFIVDVSKKVVAG